MAYQEQPVQSLSRCKVADMHTSSHRARASRRRCARLLHRSLASKLIVTVRLRVLEYRARTRMGAARERKPQVHLI